MVKIRNPLLSLGASNTINKAITFVRRRKQNIAEKKPEIIDVKSPAQLSWRHMYQKCAVLWNALNAAEKQEWESLARTRHMTGFAWFQSQCLRPNPGIYLPLQGGTMQGDIDMATYRIRNLPGPLAADEPIRLIDYVSFILPYLHHHGARAYHSVGQVIATGIWTTLAFNSERYDTDSIHDLVLNNSRLTCKTAGKYLIVGQASFVSNNVGDRLLRIVLDGVTSIAMISQTATSAQHTRLEITTIENLAVNQYAELLAWQDSGGNIQIMSDPQRSPEFMIQRIGS